jgi:hypothetical protein
MTYLNTITSPSINVSFRIDLKTIRNTTVYVRQNASVLKRVGYWIHVESIATKIRIL